MAEGNPFDLGVFAGSWWAIVIPSQLSLIYHLMKGLECWVLFNYFLSWRKNNFSTLFKLSKDELLPENNAMLMGKLGKRILIQIQTSKIQFLFASLSIRGCAVNSQTYPHGRGFIFVERYHFCRASNRTPIRIFAVINWAHGSLARTN